MLRLLSLLLMISFPTLASSDLLSVLSAGDYRDPLVVMQKAEQTRDGALTEFRTVYDDESGAVFYHLAVIAPHKEIKTLLVFNAETAEIVAETREAFSSSDITRLNAVLFMRTKRISFSGAFKQLLKGRQVYLRNAKIDSDLGINYLQVELVDPQGDHILALDFDSQKLLPILKWH